LQGEVFKGVKWVPGQAVQFYLGSLTKRAYTPMEMEPDGGSAEFLFYMHGGGPGSAWAGSLKTGDGCKVMRPKDSLDFTNFEGRAIFFGDETSMAAAYALQSCKMADVSPRYVLEVTSAAEAKSVVDRLGLEDVTLYQRTREGEHLEGVVRRLAQSAGSDSEGTDDSDKIDKSAGRVSQWIFTGQARSIQRVQKGLSLMIFSTIAILGPAINRWPFAFMASAPAQGAFFLAFPALIVAYDLMTLKRIHRSTLSGSLLIMSMVVAMLLVPSLAVWQQFTVWVQGTSWL
jgi:NADPH-dependent ferric siderophore reductase